jgi:hypothetical protein
MTPCGFGEKTGGIGVAEVLRTGGRDIGAMRRKGSVPFIHPLLPEEVREELVGGGNQSGGAQARARLLPRDEERRGVRCEARLRLTINGAVMAVLPRGWYNHKT